MTTVRSLTAFQQNALLLLADEPRSGLAIKRDREGYDSVAVNHGPLYPNPDRPVEMGLVEKSHLKRTSPYALTNAGRSPVRDRLQWVLSTVGAGEGRADELRDPGDAGL